jgi:ribosome-associated protein
MKDNLSIKNGISIPDNELEITASRSGGPGGQHVNKSDTRITVRWNIKKTVALNEKQKERVLENLQSRVTSDGDFIIHSSESRSQKQNKESALARLAKEIRKALYVPKKRMKTRVPKSAKESRLREKTHKSKTKKLRSKKSEDD